MEQGVRFGIIGVGVGANLCAEAFSLLGPGVARLIAAAGQREERVKEFASKWNLNLWYTSYMEMLEKAPIDAVIISVPHYLHCPIALDAIRLGRHVLVDKPIALNLEEADRMIEAARRSDVKLGVILQSRFDPTFRRVKQVADEGGFGRLILGEADVKWFRDQKYYDDSRWRGRWSTEGGGALINQSIHTIDLLLWIIGKPRRLWAQIGTYAHKIEVEDLAVAAIRFENGALGVIQGSTATYPGLPAKLGIYGTKGMVILEGEAIKKWSVMGEVEVVSEQTKEGLQSWARPELVPVTNHSALIKDFAEAIINDREPLVNGVEGRRSLETIMAIYISSRTGRVVDLPL
ncbi:MAG: Gfo/Idh/MocA family oxidoreductase [Nitrososphaerota archaeon]|nr:Gfo/Idh/MocA family oxidoreductase [Candidatus Bathyarchaeota archaeon]MDW8049298.1 Gfo/Idh/MocA family oxidoreductase [Nitrososphaerota archaeon]